MKAYKGFLPKLTCLGLQYAEGETYRTSGVRLCEQGFHSCLEPLDVWQFYGPTTSVFHQVDTGGAVDSSEHKQCTEKITIERRLDLQELIEAQSDYLWSKLDPLPKNAEREVVCLPSQDQPFARADGEWSIAAANGRDAIAATSRFGSIASVVSEHGSSITTGPNSVSVVSGPATKASSIGTDSMAIARGRGSSAAASGRYSVAVGNGLGGYSVATGAVSTVVATGSGGSALATGADSTVVATGYSGSALATGNRSVAIATGANGSVARAEGLNSVAIALRSYGVARVAHRGSVAIALRSYGVARGPLGAWLVLSETDSMDHITDMVVVQVGKEFDGQMIQPDVTYFLDEGRIVRDDNAS